MSHIVLVLHAIDDFDKERNTSVAHVTALERYVSASEVIYHHINDDITPELRSIAFDVVWVDVTFLCWRWVRPRELFSQIREKYRWIGELDAFCVAGPQDDYDHTDNLDAWLVELGADCILSWAPGEAGRLYPAAIAAGAVVVPSLTGFIDDEQVAHYGALQRPFEQRAIDVGYRVRRPPPNFGRFGILKSELGRRFAAAASGRLEIDISDDPAATFVGQAWPAFLGDCRYVLGCEGGASIVDRTGELRDRIAAYLQDRPEADWETMYRDCGCAELEVDPPLTGLTPRLFEIAMAGACPILVEGAYDGVVEPGRDYIPIKRDLSNIDDVIAGLGDWDRARRIAETAANTLLGDPRLRYRTWAEDIMARAENALAERALPPRDDARNQRLIAAHHRKAVSSAGRRSAGLVHVVQSEVDRLNAALRAHAEETDRKLAAHAQEVDRLNAVIETYSSENNRMLAAYSEVIETKTASYSSEIERLNAVVETYSNEIRRLNEVYGAEIERLNKALSSR